MSEDILLIDSLITDVGYLLRDVTSSDDLLTIRLFIDLLFKYKEKYLRSLKK